MTQMSYRLNEGWENVFMFSVFTITVPIGLDPDVLKESLEHLDAIAKENNAKIKIISETS